MAIYKIDVGCGKELQIDLERNGNPILLVEYGELELTFSWEEFMLMSKFVRQQAKALGIKLEESDG